VLTNFSLLDAEILAVNDVLGDAPATLNESPYEKGWIVRMKVNNEADIEKLLTADAYRAFLNK
jgi:glycine cleavage system H protein